MLYYAIRPFRNKYSHVHYCFKSLDISEMHRFKSIFQDWVVSAAPECRLDQPAMEGDFYQYCDASDTCDEGYECKMGRATQIMVCCPTPEAGM